jgi:anthranilate phosphoribosyltransferase
MIREAISKLVNGSNLTEKEAILVMEEIMSGQATDAQIGSFLTALRIKGETVEEITGFARVMRAKATSVRPKQEFLVDTCGTGGDLAGTFNISTTAAFVVAGAGVHVAKHGNKSVSSHCGSADVLEALGVKMDLPPEGIAQCIDQVGLGFLFAPLLHQAMKYAIGPRREMGIRTVFNILGPLTNPAKATAQVLGVYASELTEVMASVLGELGVKHALVVHGADNLDEISITGESMISEYKDGKVVTYTIDPSEFGLRIAPLAEIKGGTAEENVAILKRILEGEDGAPRDVVLLNAAAALIAADATTNFADGLEMARVSIDSGRAKKVLENLIQFTNSYSQAWPGEDREYSG